jgi:ATP-dependent Clp protease ATP-binding subunit ClpA
MRHNFDSASLSGNSASLSGSNLSLTLVAANPGQDAGSRPETWALERALLMLEANNAALLAEKEADRRAIVDDLVQSIASGTAPGPLKNSTVYMLKIDAHPVHRENYHHGDFENKLRDILGQVENTPGAILYIDSREIMTGDNLGLYLKPLIARGKTPVIIGATHQEYHSTIRQDAALYRRLQAISIKAPDDRPQTPAPR